MEIWHSILTMITRVINIIYIIIHCEPWCYFLLVHMPTGVPMHPPPLPMILHEWYHSFQGTPRNYIRDVAKKKLGLTAHLGHFSKWPPVEDENSNILVCGIPRDLILVFIPIF